MPDSLDLSLEAAHGLLPRAHVPYSRRPVAAVALAPDGTWIPGVRVESASFSLVIPALLNAVSTAHAAGWHELSTLVVAGSPVTAAMGAYVRGLAGTWERVGRSAWINREVETPGMRELLDPYLEEPAAAGRPGHQGSPQVPIGAKGSAPADAVVMELAREAARHAHTPESDFPVGCVLVLQDGRLLPGVNVEHGDWGSILCAERNAISTAVTYGCGRVDRVVLTCLRDATGSPCGACRQVLAEQAPNATVVMDRGNDVLERRVIESLIPGAFTGAVLGRR